MTRNQKIMQMVADGQTYGQIARALGISRSAVAGVVNRNRTTPPDPEQTKPILITDGDWRGSVEALAAMHGIKRAAAYSRARLGLMGWSIVRGGQQ